MQTDWSWRIALIAVSATTYLLSWGVLIFAYYSKYPPFRARQINILILSMISNFFFQLGALYTGGVLTFDPPFHLCYFFKIWIYCILGVYSCLAIMTYRMLRLYYISMLRKDPSGYVFWSFIIGPMVFGVVTAIIPSLGFRLMYMEAIYDQDSHHLICDFHSYFYLYLLFVIPLYFLVLMLVLSVKLRVVKQAFN
jgi:hypothetical protein